MRIVTLRMSENSGERKKHVYRMPVRKSESSDRSVDARTWKNHRRLVSHLFSYNKIWPCIAIAMGGAAALR
jgi:hypothetical protein